MAFYWVKQSLSMVDISLAYSDVYQQAGTKLNAEVWLDNELDVDLKDCGLIIEYFTADGAVDLSAFTSARPSKASVNASDHNNIGPIGHQKGNFTIPTELVGNVLIVRLSLFRYILQKDPSRCC